MSLILHPNVTTRGGHRCPQRERGICILSLSAWSVLSVFSSTGPSPSPSTCRQPQDFMPPLCFFASSAPSHILLASRHDQDCTVTTRPSFSLWDSTNANYLRGNVIILIYCISGSISRPETLRTNC